MLKCFVLSLIILISTTVFSAAVPARLHIQDQQQQFLIGGVPQADQQPQVQSIPVQQPQQDSAAQEGWSRAERALFLATVLTIGAASGTWWLFLF